MIIEQVTRARDNIKELIRNFNKSEFNDQNIQSYLMGLNLHYINFGYYTYFLEKDLCTFKNSASRSAQINAFLFHYYADIMYKDGGIIFMDVLIPFLSDNPEMIQNFMQFPYQDYVRGFKPSIYIINAIKALENKDDAAALQHIETLEAHVLKKDKSFAGFPGVLRGILEKDLESIDKNIMRSIKLLTHRPSFDSFKIMDYETISLAKVASYFGYETRVDHPLVPKELISYAPLPVYETIDFLKDLPTFEKYMADCLQAQKNALPWYKKLF